MADDYTILNPGVGGDVMDESLVIYPSAPTNRKRPRVVLTGEGLDDIVASSLTNVTGSECGIVTRPVVPNYPGAQNNAFDTVSSVPTNTETTVVSYTTGPTETFYFVGLVSSGNTNALYKLYVDGNPCLAGRTSIAGLTLSLSYSFSPIRVDPSTTIEIKVLHQTSLSCDFEATILGYSL